MIKSLSYFKIDKNAQLCLNKNVFYIELVSSLLTDLIYIVTYDVVIFIFAFNVSLLQI